MKRRIVMLLSVAVAASKAWALSTTDTYFFRYSYELEPSVGGVVIYSITPLATTISAGEGFDGEVTIPAVLGTGKPVKVIGDGAAKGIDIITSVIIPNSVTKIGANAFSGCSGLTRVQIGSGVTSIGDGAFAGCSGLTGVKIPYNVTSIGDSAFYGCGGLLGVTIPNSVTDIGDSAFYGCSKLTSVTIPSSVKDIGDSAFYGCSGLKEVRIGDGVKRIRSAVFSSCSKLASVTIPNGVTNIGYRAFSDCVALERVVIPNGVTKIEDSAFSGCYWLSSVTIPDSMMSIGNDAFDGCNVSLFDDTTIAGVELVDGWVTGSDKEISGAIVLNGARGIASYAFSYRSGLTCVTIPNSVRGIGSCAFYNCSGLTNVVIGSGVTSIERSAFSSCTKLAAVHISDIGRWSEISFGNLSANPLYYAKKLFLNGLLVEELTIPNNVRNIGSYAFYGCSGLTNVIIPDSVTSIGDSAFYGCSGLTNVTIPNSVTSIGDSAFYGCSGLRAVHISDVARWYNILFADQYANPLKYAHKLYINGLLVENLTIPDSVTNIGDYAFIGCSGLTSVVIPNSVTSIGSSAFSGCSNVREATVPGRMCGVPFGNVTNLVISAGTTSIVDNAFYGCSGLTSVTIPDSVTSIGDWAFRDCSGLTSVTIPNSVTTIGKMAFYGCSGLTSVTIGNGVASIGDWAFDCCSEIREVAVPQYVCDTGISAGISSVFPYAYRSITNVVVRDGVTSIGMRTFCDCCNLTSVTIPDSVMSVDSKAFSGCNESLFDTSSISGVKLVDGWVVGYADALSGDLNLTGARGIGDNAFYGCSGLASVTIPNTVTGIGGAAFWGCSGLASVTIPNGVTSIGGYAFYGCSRLASVIIPNSVTRIGSDAFSGCSGLVEITLPFVGACRGNTGSYDSLFGYIFGMTPYTGGTVTEQCYSWTSPSIYESCNYYIPSQLQRVAVTDETILGYGAFENCSKLRSITIPDSVTSIGSYAFNGCSRLASMTIPGGVTSIGIFAFCGCINISSVTIPDGVTSIGSYTFYGCSGLANVIIPDSVTRIGDYAFQNCSALTSVAIPSGVTNIGSCAFWGSGLTSVTIPNSVTNIGGWAFCYCSGLASVTIPNSVTSIGASVFSGCSGLKSVTIPNSVTSIGERTFANCSGLESVTIPNSVTSIGEGAFSGCSGLEEITLPFVGACRGNSGIPESLFGYIFGSSSYNGGTKTQQQCSSNSSYSYYIPSKLRKVVVTRETVLGYGAFSSCTRLASITIPASVTSIDKTAFSASPVLIDITLSQCASFTHGVSSESFYNQIRSVTIADRVTNIPSGAFWDWSRLTNVTIPDSVTSIGSDAFRGCSRLASVTIPDSVTIIGSSAFFGCSGLTSVTIPNSVASIGEDAFSGCSGLTSVYVSIGDIDRVKGLMRTYSSGIDVNRVSFIEVPRVVFVTNAEEVNVRSRYVMFGDAVGELPVLLRTGYMFAGWWTAPDGGTQISATTVVTGNMTCYAHWINPFPEIGVGVGVSEALTGMADVRLGKNIKTVEQYNAFRSWAESNDIAYKTAKGSSRTWFSYAVGADGLVEKAFEKDDVTIDSPALASNGALSFEVNVDGLSLGSSATAQNLATVFDVQGASSLADDSFSSENVDVALGVSSDGKLLVRATPKAANGTFFIRVRMHPEDGGEQVGGDPVSAIVTVTFDANGGKGGTSRSVVVGEPIGPLPIVSRDNYAFNNWWTATDGGAHVGASTIVTGDVTYYAHWIADTYTVVYKPGANGSGTQQTATKTYDVPLSLKGALFARDGYTQTGWTTSDGGAKVYDLGATYTANAAVTLYPFWTAAYTVVYKPGANGIGSQQTAAKVQDIALPLAGELFTRDGYTQTGWATSDVGAKVYDLGALYSANAAITLYPFWTANKYTVTFDANGGTGGKTVTQDYGTALSAPTVTRDGHTFTGWSPSVPATVPAGDVTYTAQWTANKYTVTFDANGGTGGKTVTLNYGAVLSAPTVTRDGFTFAGWSPSVPATVPAGNVTYMAQWTANTYTVTYDPGANGSGAQQTDTKTGGIALKLRGCMFTREGYTQTGWTKWEGVYGSYKDYDLGASYTANAAVTLYPYWTANTYTVTYKPGANGSGSQQTATKKHDIGLVLADEMFTRDGYTQTGWSVSDGGSLVYSCGVKYTENAAITFYPFWTANTYTVTYKPGANGSGAQQTDKKTGGVALTLGDAIFTRDGYTQTGWAKSDGGDKVYDLGASYAENESVTLYPYWTVNTYTVTYYNPGANGGLQQTATKTHGVALALEGAIFTRSGYTQTGWAKSDGGAMTYALGASYTANAAVTLYPFWTANTYTVTYKPGANGSGTQQTAIKTHGVALALKGAIFTRDGYTHTGWATSDGGAKQYALGASYTANAAVTLYPFWTLNTYTVTYNPGANGSGSQQTATKMHGVALALKSAIFTRSGYTQTGWTTSDGGAKAYDLGASYAANAAVTLYPFWTANTYIVTYNPGTNGSGTQQTATKTHGVAMALKSAIFTRDGYTQTGWATSDGGAKAYNLGASYSANAAVTLYPYWTVNTYTVTYKPGANGSGTQQTATKTHSVALSLKDAIFTRDGYTQTGWATSDGGAKAYNLGASYTANATVTLYPFWTAKTYKVTYKPGANGSGAQQTATKTHGVALVLKGALFTRSGYTQAGWSTSDGGAKKYALGASYTANAAVTLYPFWTKEHDKVQLWKGGPYWATTNIGADDPSELGYYFWWGDTVGYKYENGNWVASDGSTSSFSFSSGNAPTYNKNVATLRSGGWITADSILVPAHDAAHVHWDDNWRMPTKQELADLNSKCNWSWTTKNGVGGYLVRGKGDYTSASIFLPVGGQGSGAWITTSFGGYWSSAPSASSNCAYNLDITEDYHDIGESNRYIGLPIRPVQSFTE